MTTGATYALSRDHLGRIFTRHDPARLPALITLDATRFFHWFEPSERVGFFVFEEADLVRGLTMDIGRHGGKPTRLRRCELCGRFVDVYRLYSLRSVVPRPDPPGAYRATYSYICRSAEGCRRHASIREQPWHFFRKHLGAAEPTWILRPGPWPKEHP